uniref:Uncharacterized protein n=1 Tax=Schizaphis graminum TaxID=13262 RepID=A0A2S2P4V0_SCHGA
MDSLCRIARPRGYAIKRTLHVYVLLVVPLIIFISISVNTHRYTRLKCRFLEHHALPTSGPHRDDATRLFLYTRLVVPVFVMYFRRAYSSTIVHSNSKSSS